VLAPSRWRPFVDPERKRSPAKFFLVLNEG
jgi:hypothetical protein